MGPHHASRVSLLRLWVILPTRDHSLDYLEFRLWIGLWVAFFGVVLVATEASHLVQYFTRFTEEGFCALISLIFIYDSLKKMLSLADAFPINWQYRLDNVTSYSCVCNLSSPGETKQLCGWWETGGCHTGSPLGPGCLTRWQKALEEEEAAQSHPHLPGHISTFLHSSPCHLSIHLCLPALPRHWAGQRQEQGEPGSSSCGSRMEDGRGWTWAPGWVCAAVSSLVCKSQGGSWGLKRCPH